MIHTPTWENQLHATKWNKTKLKHYVMWREVMTTLQAINAGAGVEKREPSYTVGGNAN